MAQTSLNCMQFLEILAKWYIGAPPLLPRGFAPPPAGNPRSATVLELSVCLGAFSKSIFPFYLCS